MNPRRTHLLIIDPQNDFCDLPASYLPGNDRPTGAAATRPSLPVAGAHADLQRVAALIRQADDALTDITVTLDSHQRLDIAHPTFWRQGDDQGSGAVLPFTPITAGRVRAGRFVPRDPAARERALAYLDALEARGRYTLMVWPVHCEIGSWGHNVHADVRAAYNQWEERHLRSVVKVTKGENPWTEHYSAVLAEVPDADDPRTQLNRTLLDDLDRAEQIWIAGEAGSHCVKATVEDIVANLADPGRITLLGDCMSPVAGFGDAQAGFLAAMQARGVRLATAAGVLASLSVGAPKLVV